MKRATYLQILTACGLFLSLILALPVDAQSKKDRRAAEKFITEARQAAAQKNYRIAAEKYGEALKLVPTNADAHFRKGAAHAELNENDLALASFDLAKSQGYSNLVDLYLFRWRIHYANKNYEAALADVREGLKLAPDNTDFLLALGDISAANNAPQEAIEAYQKAALKVPNSGDVFYNIAKIHFSLADSAKQAEAAEAAIKNRTRFLSESLYLLADAYQKQGKKDEALVHYQRAITAKADIFDAYRNMAEIYRSQNRINEAIDISRKALRVFEKNPAIYTDLSFYYSLADRHEDAVQAALAAISFSPNEALAFTNLCRAYNDVKKPEMAISACNTALKLNPDDGETLFYLGRAYDLTNRPAEATKAYKRAVTGLLDFTAKNPGYSNGHYLLGNALFADNQRAKAIEAYKRSLELNPTFVKARYNMGIIQVLEKNKAGALEQYNRLVSIDQGLAAKLKAEIDRL